MSVGADELLTTVAQELRLSEDEVLRQGLRTLLQRQIRTIRAEVLEIHGRYGITSAEEMEDRYRDGSLEEATSWRDLQRLDRLEYRRTRLLNLVGSMTRV
jgi:Arc/MetJ-type ribon-helix-helix transcriptional regulator